jgi:hypothetical protein
MRYYVKYWDGKRYHTIVSTSVGEHLMALVDLADAGLLDRHTHSWTEEG